MTTTSPTPVLSTDHIDLLVTAATDWRLLASPTTAAFAQSPLEHHVVVASATDAGRLLRSENVAAVRSLSDRGRTRLVDRGPVETYTHHRVDHLDPVEVIKAVHAAQAACSDSPSWSTSPAARLLDALITAATHRLPGYTTAPWWWTRPQMRSGQSVGVLREGSTAPEVPGLTWITPNQLREHWPQAPLIIIRVDAAADIPADLPARAGVFILGLDGREDSNQIWEAVTALDMPALVMLWPACAPWLHQQLQDPEPQFIEHRSPS